MCVFAIESYCVYVVQDLNPGHYRLLKYCNLFSLRSAHATQLGPGCKKIFVESAQLG